jgi:group I intron endonuclease
MTTSGTYTVYQITNSVNGKTYIGITSRSMAIRWREHMRHARYFANKGMFYRAIRKYGGEAFRIAILSDGLCWEAAKTEEIRLIASFSPEYNSTKGGDGTAGHRVTEEGRRRMSEANIGNKYNLGRIWTDRQRADMSLKKKGCAAPPVSEQMKITRAQNMRRASDARKRPVICLADGKTFPSATEAALFYGWGKTSVSTVCSGKRKSVYGIRFTFTGAL